MHGLKSDLANGFRRYVRKLWASRGGGFYGFVAVLMFLYLEGIDLAGDLAGLAGASISLGWIIGMVVDFFVDAVVNTVRAAIWPVSWIGQFGVGILSGSLLLGCYATYRAMRPTVFRWLGTPGDDPEALAALAAQQLPEARRPR